MRKSRSEYERGQLVIAVQETLAMLRAVNWGANYDAPDSAQSAIGDARARLVWALTAVGIEQDGAL